MNEKRRKTEIGDVMWKVTNDKLDVNKYTGSIFGSRKACHAKMYV